MKLIQNTNNLVSGWLCDCEYYNDILRPICWNCSKNRPKDLDVFVPVIWFRRTGTKYPDLEEKMTDDRYTLYTRFFANETDAVQQMNDEELMAHIEEMESFSFELKARLHSARNNKTLRDGISAQKERSLLTKGDLEFDSDSAISTIAGRKKRQSKQEKLQSELTKILGVSATSEILGKLEKAKFNPLGVEGPKRQEKVTSTAELCRINRHEECPGKFRIGEESFICKCECHKKPEDLNSLFASLPK